MHGREQREGENYHRRIVVVPKSSCGGQHMQSVPLSTTRNSLADGVDSSLFSTDTTTTYSFCKDSRKISVGDCALFKPPQDSPPFIGIIRCVRSGKENNLQLGVNWLYRPAELKLGKGILLDAAPNEIFYSFHKDEIPVASLLHPCKVAFLPECVELPKGISSFVCRRVYDIDNKCLWWLTDQDYINERQEEVDKLLQKTRIEMDAAYQSGNRSPKPINNSVSTSQFKPVSDNVQSSATSVLSQTKGKKRDRGDQSSDPGKRERSLKSDDGDSGLYKSESSLRFELAQMTEKGGLVDSDSVEKLVQLMQPDKVDKKMDLISRTMLAGVIAATEKLDCLNQFVQLKGLSVFDEWLQDVHKGKIGDSDKSAEDFLLVLLRALDKLPVDLHALQTCNIGRSVNHLRSHKILEIQKKARSLVDTWKKRVEVEMNIIDAKSGSTEAASWPSKSRLPEAHGGRSSVGSGDVALKSSVTQFSGSKPMSIKVSQVESAGKSASQTPGAIKSASSPASGKESQPRTVAGSTSDFPLSTREEKSSSSSQSLNYSPSFSGKEDARSSTAGSMSVNRISSGGSRHRKSGNGFPGTLVAGSQKETGSSKNSSIHRNTAQEKFSQSVVTGEKALEAPVVEGSTPKLIVKLPNWGRSPAQSVSGVSFEDPSNMSSRASSPVLSEKHEQPGHNAKEKADAFRTNVISDVNAESWQSNDFKDLHTGSDEGDGSPAALPDEERSRTLEDGIKGPEVAKAASSSSGNGLKTEKMHDASFSSMNAFIENCVKYSEASTPVSLGDDVGMNLLASVAAGEMCKSDLLTPANSPQVCTPPVEEHSNGEGAKSKSSAGETLVRDQCQPNDAVDGDGDRKAASASSDEILQVTTDHVTEMNEKSDDNLVSSAFAPTMKAAKDRDGDPSKQLCEQMVVEVKCSARSSSEDMKHKVEGPSNLSMESECKKDSNEMLNTIVIAQQNSAVKAEGGELPTIGSVKDLVPENVDGRKVRDADDEDHGDSSGNQSAGATVHPQTSTISAPEDQNVDVLHLDATDQNIDSSMANPEMKSVDVPHSFGSCSEKEEPAVQAKEVDGDMELRNSKKSNVEAAGMEEQVCTVVGTSSLTVTRVLEMDSKMNFDLNEGLIGDDGKYGEPANLASGCLSTVHLVNPLSTTVSSVSNGIHASITVAAAAKGPFCPPVDLLRNKGELGWKGSAATSAFRPAEPRKVLQLQLGSANVCPDDSTSKPHRPPLDIDLNVPDERVLEDIACRDSRVEIGSTLGHVSNLDGSRSELTGSAPGRSSGGLDLDLNRVDDANDITHSTSSCRKLEAHIVPFKSLSSSSLPNTELRRDFDLNNGPGFDDGSAEQASLTQHTWGSTQSVHSLQARAGLGINNLEAGNFSAWFPPGNSYPSTTVPSSLPDRGEQPFPIIPPGAQQRILGPSGGNPFNPDIYRGSVLSSSPAVPFPSSPFPYQLFPFGTSLPLPSAAFSVGSNSFIDSTSGGRIYTPPVNSQFVGAVGAISSQYPRPYVVNLADGSNNGGVESNRKWSRQVLDLNAGPGILDIDGREELLAQRQLSVGSSQALAQEQGRMFPLSGAVLKRKEPEGGWDGESFRHKQSSWQ